MKKILECISSDTAFKAAQKLYEAAFQTQNLTLRYKFLQEGDSCKRIARELVKWETPTRGY